LAQLEKDYFHMDSAGFLRFAADIVGKDWNEHGKFLLKVAAAMAIGVLLVMRLGPGEELAKGIIVGAGVVSPYGFSQLCFFIQRRHGLLKPLMVPPITPTQLVLAKYASAFSMALFVVNVPGILLGDFAFVGHVNIGVLLLTSICMAVVVISTKPWAPLVPIWIVLLPYLYARPILQSGLQWVSAHGMGVSIAAVCLIPFIVYGSALIFETDMRRS
jgi:hypothetical protein